MPTVSLSPIYQWPDIDQNGDPRSGAQLFTYAAGSSTKQNTYTSSAGSVAHTNPIILSSNGTPPNPIFLVDGQSYKFVLAPRLIPTPHQARFGRSTTSPGSMTLRRPHKASGSRRRRRRFIPACAGNSSTVAPRCRRSGSSPRVRGTGQVTGHADVQSRFIPACAGNSIRDQQAARTIAGSSPRVRGTAARCRISHGSDAVHPRVCGEQRLVQMCVTSPPVHPRVCGEQYIISGRGRDTPVHPRVCGEQVRRTGIVPPGIGSSPRVRGTGATGRGPHPA